MYMYMYMYSTTMCVHTQNQCDGHSSKAVSGFMFVDTSSGLQDTVCIIYLVQYFSGANITHCTSVNCVRTV